MKFTQRNWKGPLLVWLYLRLSWIYSLFRPIFCRKSLTALLLSWKPGLPRSIALVMSWSLSSEICSKHAKLSLKGILFFGVWWICYLPFGVTIILLGSTKSFLWTCLGGVRFFFHGMVFVLALPCGIRSSHSLSNFTAVETWSNRAHVSLKALWLIKLCIKNHCLSRTQNITLATRILCLSLVKWKNSRNTTFGSSTRRALTNIFWRVELLILERSELSCSALVEQRPTSLSGV